jgi:hypothetical protein
LQISHTVQGRWNVTAEILKLNAKTGDCTMSRGSYVKVNELLADYDSYTTVNNCDDNESKSQINSISDCFNY